MAWYRSIAIDTPNIVKPEFIEEYKEGTVGYPPSRTFTVVNPGLYFLGAYGTSKPLRISTNTSNPVLYDMNNGNNNNDRFRLMHLDAGDTVSYSGDGYNTQSYLYWAVRITNAEFSSVKYTNRAVGSSLTYSNDIDGNSHFIFYEVNGNSTRSDNSDISSECTVLSYGSSADKSWIAGKCIGLVANDDLAYIDTNSDGSSVVLDFVLTPVSPKIAGTLTAGQSTITLYDQRIRENSHISAVYAETWYLDITVNDGSCTIEFPVQDTDMDVEIEVE